jgi:hypothetical protein
MSHFLRQRKRQRQSLAYIGRLASTDATCQLKIYHSVGFAGGPHQSHIVELFAVIVLRGGITELQLLLVRCVLKRLLPE